MAPRFSAFILLLVLVCKSSSDEHETSHQTTTSFSDDPSVIISSPQELSVQVGDTVVFACRLSHLAQNIQTLTWKRGRYKVLFAGSLKTHNDEKFGLVDKTSLRILEVTSDYAGEYVCQTGRHEDVHILHVLVPPSIKLHPEDGHIFVKRGDSITARCNAIGYPLPRVTWTSTQGTLPGNVQEKHGSLLSIASADIQHTGTYGCIAENGVGVPASETLKIRVLYAPEVIVSPTWIHAGVGSKIELKCQAKSMPSSFIRWTRYQNATDIEEDSHISFVRFHDQEVILRIRRMSEEHYGSYTCHANNTIGSASATSEISGLAETVKFKSNLTGDEDNSFLLFWTVKSYIPLMEYMLKLRSTNEGPSSSNAWTDVTIPANTLQTILYSDSYNITGLKPGIEYEVVMQAKNKVGWNHPSETFTFRTNIEGGHPNNWEQRTTDFTAQTDKSIDKKSKFSQTYDSGNGIIWKSEGIIILIQAVLVFYSNS